MRIYRKPFPDDEAHWVTLPAELICCAVALSDPEFAKKNQQHLDDARTEAKPLPRKKKP